MSCATESCRMCSLLHLHSSAGSLRSGAECVSKEGRKGFEFAKGEMIFGMFTETV